MNDRRKKIIIVLLILIIFELLFIAFDKDKKSNKSNSKEEVQIDEKEDKKDDNSINNTIPDKIPDENNTIVEEQKNQDTSSNNISNNSNKSAKITGALTDKELEEKLDYRMNKGEYNEYAKKIIKSLIPDYKKLFTNTEIYNIFADIDRIILNPYDPNYPDRYKTNRAYNATTAIVINCYKGELEEGNWNGLRWLLTHELMHSLGEFYSNEYTDGSYGISQYIRTRLLEEGLSDSIAHYANNSVHNNSFAVVKQDNSAMYRIDDNNNVDLSNNNNHTYTISGNFISVFKYVGCYDEIIHANINGSFKNVKTCMSKKVKNGDAYFDKFMTIMNNIYLYTSYPNTIYSKDEMIKRYENSNDAELKNFLYNNNLNDLFIKYSDLSSEIINNKIDKTYSICDFYKTNRIMYSTDGGKTFKTKLNCKK